MKAIVITLSVVVGVVLMGWIGLHIKPAAYPVFAPQAGEVATIPLPKGLPAPVERFYRATYGDKVPVINTAVVSGRGSMRLGKITVPIRFRFTHETGHGFRHDIDLALFGLPLMKGLDVYIDGHGWGKTPGGIEEGEGFDQGSNISLWAEAINWFPAVLVTDSRVHWKPVDDATALLDVPYGNKRDVLVVRFDPKSGLVQHTEAMKYKSAKGEKVLWVNGTWSDEGKPWIHLNVENTLFNVDVRDYIRAAKP